MPVKKILILSIICLFTGFCLGQEVIWGLENKSKSANYSPTIIGEDKFYFYCASPDKKNYLIEKYDKKIMKRRYSIELLLPKINGNSPETECVGFFSGKFVYNDGRLSHHEVVFYE